MRDSKSRDTNEQQYTLRLTGADIYVDYEGSQTVPIRPSDKGWFNESKAFRSVEGKEIVSGENIEVEKGLAVFVNSFEF